MCTLYRFINNCGASFDMFKYFFKIISELKMVRQLDVYSKIEFRGTVKFSYAKNSNPMEINLEVCTVYGEQAIGKWCKQFEESRTELQDEPSKGRPSTSTTADHIGRVDEVFHMNHWIKN